MKNDTSAPQQQGVCVLLTVAISVSDICVIYIDPCLSLHQCLSVLVTCSSKQSLGILMTPLKTLELSSLRSVKNGDIWIIANKDLCLADSVNWAGILHNPKQVAEVRSNRLEINCSEQSNCPLHEELYWIYRL